MAERPKIAIIGKGNVGSNLQKGLSRAGYSVRTSGHDAKAVQTAAKDADVLILAVPDDQLMNVVKELDGKHKGKILVDVTNVLTKDQEFGGNLQESNAERLQKMTKDAKVVKAFNTVFADTMSSGRVNGDRLSVFVAGDDMESRRLVEGLARDIGFDAVDAGPLKNARYLETLGFLNITLGFKLNMGTDIGFRLIHADRESGPSGA